MPADPRQWLPAGHLAWRVPELAGEMDLPGFGGYRADGQGGRPYHPAMMATLLLYCYCRGRRSSRETGMATFDDVGARVICGGLHPDHSAVAEFVHRNAGAVLTLLPESVRACAAGGLVSLEVAAGDGTKLKANAAMAGNLTRGQLEAQIAGLEGWTGAELRSWVRDMLDGEGITAPAAAAPRGGGPGGGKGKWKSRPARAGQMLQRRLEARAGLDARQCAEQDKAQGSRDARAAELAARVARKETALARWEGSAQARIDARAARAAAGQRPCGRVPFPVSADREVARARQALADARAGHAAALAGTGAGERRPDGRRRPGRPKKPGGVGESREAEVSPADPSSRVVPLKKGGYDQLFNVQALATARTRVILAVTRHGSPADAQALLPLLEEARRVLRAAGITGEITRALSGAGYASEANFTADIPGTLYVAVARESRQTGRSADGRGTANIPPAGKTWQPASPPKRAGSSTGSAPPPSSPSSPSPPPGSAAPCTTAEPSWTPNSPSGPPATTSSRPSPPARAAAGRPACRTRPPDARPPRPTAQRPQLTAPCRVPSSPARQPDRRGDPPAPVRPRALPAGATSSFTSPFRRRQRLLPESHMPAGTW